MAQDNTVTRIRFGKISLTKNIDTEEGHDTAALVWSIRNGYPRMTVYTSNNKAVVNGKANYDYIITAPFDYVSVQIFLNRLQEAIDATKEVKYRIDCFNTKWENGVKTNEKALQAQVIVGRDHEGVIYIAVLEESKRSIKFSLLPSEWFIFYDDGGNPISDKAVLSKMYAQGYLKTISKLLNFSANKDLISVVKTETNIENGKLTQHKETSVSSASLDDILA